ncbi:NAD-dependent epimerase/dehydratase family protein [Chitinophaga oryziterrae]|uniref:NAD-dependent epimerase/dehydratase family protein n=1 Tax=Chitinophaga oryziterrae TaxID=1031224 RepID=A0A6N8JED4_9BACT|nr:NAD-dependent epimerase/dehydratase family protein [Chitinophaga oryziterrae]MVT42492.1 NAD-dependent epimerase/dehydratase family protein [Chitinophaga oryziterrae]
MILVTGGTGFLGSNLLRKLVDVGEPVRALYRTKIPYQLKDIEDKIEWVTGDILDVCTLEDVMEGVDKVYHCAAVVSFHPKNHREMMKVNVEGTANVVNLAIDAGVKKLVHVSSVAALGRAKANGVIDEENEWQESKNNSQYAVSKYLAEMEVWRANAEGLATAIVNPSIILGSGFWDDPSSMLVRNAWKEFPFYTDGVTGFTDVNDVTDVMMRLMESDIKGQRFILSAENYGYRELFTEMATRLGKKPPHIAVRPWLAEIVWRVEGIKAKLTGKKALLTKETARTAQMKVYYNNSKIQTALPGFTFTPLKTTIARMCGAFKEHQILSQK